MKTVKGTRKQLTGTNHKTFKKKCKNKENCYISMTRYRNYSTQENHVSQSNNIVQ